MRNFLSLLFLIPGLALASSAIQPPTTAVMQGDSGAGGVAGSVPAPPAGSAAAQKDLQASGSWVRRDSNVLLNPGFEGPTYNTSWTVATATGAAETTEIYEGAQSLKLTYSSQTGGVSQSVTPAVHTTGYNWMAVCRVNTTMATMEVCGLTGGNKAACTNVPATGTWQTVVSNFVGPANGTSVGVNVDTTASGSGTVYVDKCEVKAADNAPVLSQPVFFGSVVVNGCSGSALFTTSSSGSWANLSTNSGCTYTAAGNAVAPATQIAGIKFASMPPGEYIIQAEGQFESSNNLEFWRFSDGTNTSREVSTGASHVPGINHSISYSTAQSNVTLQIQGQVQTGFGGTIGVGANDSFGAGGGSHLTIKVYYYPSQQQQGYNPSITPANWNGYHQATSGAFGMTSSGTAFTFTDFASGPTGLSLVTNTSRNMSCSNGSSTVPSLSCTLPRVGNYFLCFNTWIADATSLTNDGTYVRAVDGSGTFIAEGITSPWQVGTAVGISACGHYSATVAGATTFKLQAASQGTSHALNMGYGLSSNVVAIGWNIVELDAPMPAPFLTGSVTSASTTGAYHIEHVNTNSANCTSSPCTIKASSGISSVTRTGTGTYVVNFVSGTFSDIPTCIGSANNFGSAGSTVSLPGGVTTTTSAATFQTINANSGFALADAAFNIICMGPR